MPESKGHVSYREDHDNTRHLLNPAAGARELPCDAGHKRHRIP
jgi:hypothetical protein